MTGHQRQAVVQLGAVLVGAAVISRLLGGAERRPNPWRTVRSRTRERVFVDDAGRILDHDGLPETFRGVDYRDVPPVRRQIRRLEGERRRCKKRLPPARFRSKREAIAALLDANPALAEFIDSDGKGANDRRYRAWVQGGRRGPKPRLGEGDGRFDAINERMNLRGARRVSSWSEALDVIAGADRTWASLERNLPLLEEATGLRLNPPEPALERSAASQARTACLESVDADEAAVWTEAKRIRF